MFLFFFALAVVFTAPVSLEPHARAVNDGDPLHISWILAWDAHQLVRDPLHLFDSNTFYPYESSLAFSEHLLGIVPFSAPFYYVTGNALLAQNLALLLTLALSATGMYLLAREILGRRDAALVAGMVFVFHSYNFRELPRIQLLSAQWFPFALLFLHRFFVNGRSKDALWFGLFFLLHGLANIYYLFYFAILLAFWIPAYALLVEGGVKRTVKLVPPLGIAGGVFALVAIPYLRMVRTFGYRRSLSEGVDLIEYVRPPDGSLFAQFLSLEPPLRGAPQFLGFVALGLAVLGLVKVAGRLESPKRILFWLSFATAIVGLVLSLGPLVRVSGTELTTGPYRWLYEYVPLFRVLRSPQRMSVLVHFGLAIVAGLGAKLVFSRLSARALPWARVALLVVLPYEHFTGGQPFARVPTGDDVPEVYRWLRETPETEPVVELPLFPRSQLRRHALYMFYSTYHWRPILFGRTSFYPPLAGYLAWELRSFPDDTSIRLLERFGVARVVVHPRLWAPEERGSKLALLERHADRLVPERTFDALPGGAHRRYGLGEERVYRLRHAGELEGGGPLCTPTDEIEPDGWVLSGEAETPHAWALDRDPATVWRTKDRQLPGWKLQVDLGSEEVVSAVRLKVGYPHDEFPRDLTLKARVPGARFERVFFREDLETKWELASALVDDPAEAAMTLRFEPTRARRLRFWVRERKSFDYTLPNWSLPELHIYRRCEVVR